MDKTPDQSKEKAAPTKPYRDGRGKVRFKMEKVQKESKRRRKA
jgi:hypothetical protein